VAPQRIAVAGAGVSGLTAAYVPDRGGRARNHDVTASDGRGFAVDSGFVVFNFDSRTYPTLLKQGRILLRDAYFVRHLIVPWVSAVWS
jgi:predicted NAD/FAD-binding protein